MTARTEPFGSSTRSPGGDASRRPQPPDCSGWDATIQPMCTDSIPGVATYPQLAYARPARSDASAAARPAATCTGGRGEGDDVVLALVDLSLALLYSIVFPLVWSLSVARPENTSKRRR